MAEQLYHLGLNVRDFDKSYDFYTQVVGMTVDTNDRPHRSVLESGKGPITFIENDREGAFMTTGAAVEELLNATDEIAIKSVHLMLGDFRLQLIHYVNGGGEPVDLRHNSPGSLHLCFQVDDAHAKLREIESRGDVKVTHRVVRIIPTMDSFYVEDPDGVPIEFLQVVASEMAELAA